MAALATMGSAFIAKMPDRPRRRLEVAEKFLTSTPFGVALLGWCAHGVVASPDLRSRTGQCGRPGLPPWPSIMALQGYLVLTSPEDKNATQL